MVGAYREECPKTLVCFQAFWCLLPVQILATLWTHHSEKHRLENTVCHSLGWHQHLSIELRLLLRKTLRNSPEYFRPLLPGSKKSSTQPKTQPSKPLWERNGLNISQFKFFRRFSQKKNQAKFTDGASVGAQGELISFLPRGPRETSRCLAAKIDSPFSRGSLWVAATLTQSVSWKGKDCRLTVGDFFAYSWSSLLQLFLFSLFAASLLKYTSHIASPPQERLFCCPLSRLLLWWRYLRGNWAAKIVSRQFWPRGA